MVDKILIWECEVCGKVIKSLHENQLEHNKTAHMATHVFKRKKKR